MRDFEAGRLKVTEHGSSARLFCLQPSVFSLFTWAVTNKPSWLAQIRQPQRTI